MATPGGLRIFGFPLHIRPGFALLLLLVVIVNNGPIGLWLAAGITGFTLIHELGHAFAARATGARAEISLDFLAGYASFQPTRRLKAWERAGISFAGPAVQIVGGLAVLAVMGVNPLDWNDVRSTDAGYALWWAGPMIGVFNLVPVLPLDGGNIVTAGLELVIPDRARTVMVYVSLAITLGGAVVLYLNSDVRPLAAFLVFPLLLQLQMLSATRPANAAKQRSPLEQRTALAEAAAWSGGAGAISPAEPTLSPWVRAHHALALGDSDRARRILQDDFADPRPPAWWPPDAAPNAALAALVALLPRPLPTGRPYSELVLAGVLARLREYETAAHYAAALHQRDRSAMSALLVARCAAALGDHALALQWLQVAAASSTQPAWLAHAIDTADEFAALRSNTELQQLRRELVSAA